MKTTKDIKTEEAKKNHVSDHGTFSATPEHDRPDMTGQMLDFVNRLAGHIESMKARLMDQEENMTIDEIKETLFHIWKMESDILKIKKMNNFTEEKYGLGLEDPWRDLHWIAEYTGLSYRTLQNQVSAKFQERSKNPIPIFRIGGKVVSKQSILDEWIMSQK